MSYVPSLPGDTNLMQILMLAPERGKVLFEYTRAVMREPSALSAGQRELIFAYCSGLNACTYCYGQHSVGAVALGVEETLLDELMEDIDSSSAPDDLKPILHLVRKLTLTPSRVAQSDVDKVLAAGWDERAYFDVVSVCALANFMNRLVDGTGTAMDGEALREMGGRIAEGGYQPRTPPPGAG